MDAALYLTALYLNTWTWLPAISNFTGAPGGIELRTVVEKNDEIRIP